jgi:ferredoxin--NADP+ reductase
MTASDSPVRIAVIGSGPAGFYAAGHLLKDSAQRVEVDMIERLPTPWGLVRSGVAPDHPKIKSVTRVYEKTAVHPRFRYFDNVTFGVHISREELLERYHAIVYATGSPKDRPLGIPGEELPGSHAATDFVGWYNGHPDYPDHEFDLSCERAVVIGNGNVALDVARMLTLTNEELACTDVADHALEALDASEIKEIVVAGRRGPAQAAFTNPELLELGELADAEVIVSSEELERALAVNDPNMDPTAERNVKVLRDYAQRTPAGKRRRIVLRFLLSPVELHGDERGTRRELLRYCHTQGESVEQLHEAVREDRLRVLPLETSLASRSSLDSRPPSASSGWREIGSARSLISHIGNAADSWRLGRN